MDDIQSVGRSIQEHINQHWESCFQQCQSKMVEMYPEIGDSVYAIYGKQLFQKVHDRFKALGLQASPRLPGSLMNSRNGAKMSARGSAGCGAKSATVTEALAEPS